ncbi:hypothetical protein NUU61_001833 [Penicillium alfredii]|uniref:Uncharacterized protein n=1 Tax=Penicillium alfredii TaxID=1506179 RepID=A0A9W9FQF3_9EURO|nr:uncharacterized protein NUU61_001833 [Penicillium alfredii]KAJ5104486.1 hypothetical protein NUU61_001833 [Penicillium alfredii]
MSEFLECTRPWETHTGLKPQIPDAFWDRSHRWHEGDHMFQSLDHIVQAFLDDETPISYVDNYALRPFHHSKYEWVIRPYTKSEDVFKPHVNAFVTDSEALLPDRLGTGEVSTAFGLITQSQFQDGYNSYRYIPVTIFSASDRQMRVLQCWHDKQNPKTRHVRRSPIMEFRHGMRANWRDWVTVLCWIAGRLVGDTDTENGSEAVGRLGTVDVLH